MKKEEIIVPEDNKVEHTLVLKGEKEEAAVLALKLEKQDKNILEEVSRKIKENKGIVYSTDEHVLGIFVAFKHWCL